MSTFLLDLITPQKLVYSEEVDQVIVPTVNGSIGVLAHHVPLFCPLVDGEIKIVSGKKEFFLAIGGGFMQISKDKVMILVSRAAHADEINEKEIKEATEAAKEAIKRKVSGAELDAARAILRRSIIDLKVIRRRTHRSTQLPS